LLGQELPTELTANGRTWLISIEAVSRQEDGEINLFWGEFVHSVDVTRLALKRRVVRELHWSDAIWIRGRRGRKEVGDR
jgi:hypothetical protein